MYTLVILLHVAIRSVEEVLILVQLVLVSVLRRACCTSCSPAMVYCQPTKRTMRKTPSLLPATRRLAHRHPKVSWS